MVLCSVPSVSTCVFFLTYCGKVFLVHLEKVTGIKIIMKTKSYIAVICVFIILPLVHSLEEELTLYVEAGKEDCFFQNAKKGDVIDLEYQVIDGGHGDLDIIVRIADPTGRVLVADHKKSENNHRVDAVMDGDYRFCFDNTFSSYNTKTVFLELIIEGEDSDWSIDVNNDTQYDITYEMKIKDMEDILNKVREHLKRIRHLQDLIKSTEARDRNVAEENYFKVNTFSLCQLVLMSAVGFVQVVMLKSLFDDKSRVHKIWKNLDKNMN